MLEQITDIKPNVLPEQSAAAGAAHRMSKSGFDEAAEIQSIPLNQILADEPPGELREGMVEVLINSISEVGLLQPIVVRRKDDKYFPVCGYHRIEACKRLNYSTIPARVVNFDDINAQIAQIDEDLCRKHLSRLDTVLRIVERKKLYLQLHPETRRGTAGALARHNRPSDTLSFVADSALKMGKSKREISRYVAKGEFISENLTGEVIEMIKDKPAADNLSGVLTLASQPPATQMKIGALIRDGKATSVQTAYRQINPKTATSLNPLEKCQKELNKVYDSIKDFENTICNEGSNFASESVIAEFQQDMKFIREKFQDAISKLRDELKEQSGSVDEELVELEEVPF